jgi:hypothetical protein
LAVTHRRVGVLAAYGSFAGRALAKVANVRGLALRCGLQRNQSRSGVALDGSS